VQPPASDVMFSLPLGVVSRDHDHAVLSRHRSLHRGEIAQARAARGSWLRSSLARGIGPWAGALVGHGNQVVQPRASDSV